ncbi:28S ribosomal protein S18b, mitochondrial, partial [Clarias magur]
MAASLQNIVRAACRVSPVVLQRIHRAQTIQDGVRVVFVTPVLRQFFNSARLACEGVAAQAVETHCRYKDTPWEYLESEEYIERYGSRPVWADYRRNHKGGIPPQKTRKTCIRGDKICGNPCPICRDPNIIIHYQNINLLQQFISPHTGMVYDPTRTGVCMKQQKLLNKAIETARDH